MKKPAEICNRKGKYMQLICAWCTQSMGTTGLEDGISHGICSVCAARVLSEDALRHLESNMIEIVKMLGLVLEMVGDLYEVAQALAPKAGVGMQPAMGVRTWQHQRNDNVNSN